MIFRPIEVNDAELVVRWRNANRDCFFDNKVITTDTHLEFMRNRKLHNLIWIAEVDGEPIGMVGLKVDVEQHIAEYRSVVVDENYRGRGYGREIQQAALDYAFKILRVKQVWVDYLASNEIGSRLYADWILEGVDLPGHTSDRGAVCHAIWRNA